MRSELDVDVTADGATGLPAAVEVAAYRIVSEALANVVKHARASHVDVRLEGDAGALTVTVADDGRGIGRTSPPGSACCRCASAPRSSAAGARWCARSPAAPPSARSCRTAPPRATPSPQPDPDHHVEPAPDRTREEHPMTEPTTTPIRVLIADDHPVFRDGLASLLDPLPGIDVVARASDGAEAVALVDEHRPDVVIMDVQMPEMNGIDATRAVVAAHPEVGVLVLTMGEDDGTVLSALRAGARGYLRKGAEQDEIVRAVTTVHGGGVVFGASLAARIAEVLAPASRPERPFPELTERETEVLDLIAAGRSNGQIAQALFLSPKTIRNNITSILAKLQATDRADVIIRARDAGLGRQG